MSKTTTPDRRRSSVRRPSINSDKLGAMTMSSMPKPGSDFVSLSHSTHYHLPLSISMIEGEEGERGRPC